MTTLKKEHLGITEREIRELNDESVFYCNHDDLEKAVTALKWLTFFEPLNVSHHLRLGTVLLEKEQYKEALKVFLTGAFLSPENPKFPLYIGTCLFMLEEKEDAKKAFMKAIELSKNDENYKEVFVLATEAIAF